MVRKSGHGIFQVELKGFADVLSCFTDPKHQRALDAFVFRGQRDPSWKLEPSLTRRLRHCSPHEASQYTLQQLRSFLLALRGRTPIPADVPHLLALVEGSGHYKEFFDRLTPPQRSLIHEIWALGQHHCLWTPCLDWTTSPFTALFFALTDPVLATPKPGTCVVYALNRVLIEAHCKSPAFSSAPVEFLQPLTATNSRLDTQSGVLTFCPNSVPLDAWIEQHFYGTPSIALVAFRIEEIESASTTRALDQMNINHRTLFPDLEGASRLCNQRLLA